MSKKREIATSTDDNLKAYFDQIKKGDVLEVEYHRAAASALQKAGDATSAGKTTEIQRAPAGAKPGMEQPLYYWDPVIAPSGLLFYTGDAIPGWKGSLLIGSLRPGLLVRLRLADGRVVLEERYLGDLGARIRDVRQGPDGHPYLLTDHSDGRVLRVIPASQ